jgi:hypothetical protein
MVVLLPNSSMFWIFVHVYYLVFAAVANMVGKYFLKNVQQVFCLWLKEK